MGNKYRVYRYSIEKQALVYKIYPKEIFDNTGWNHSRMWFGACSLADDDRFDEIAREMFLHDIEVNRNNWLYVYNEKFLDEIYNNIKNNKVELDGGW